MTSNISNISPTHTQAQLQSILHVLSQDDDAQSCQSAETTHVSAEQVQTLLLSWLQECDRGQKAKLLADTLLNDMHIVGMGLCVLAARRAQERALQESSSFTLKRALGNFYDRIIFEAKPESSYELEDIHNLACALQLRFEDLYENRDENFVCAIAMHDVCLWILAHIGSWLQVRYKDTTSATRAVRGAAEIDMPDAALKGFVDMAHDRFCTLRLDAVSFILNAVHSMLGLHFMLTGARHVRKEQDIVEVIGHHKEASSETFFTLSMTADCMPGSIAQYAHKFAYLFHSISQVIYYNFPTYNRQRQLSLEELQKENACAVNVLPLLTELRPDIPVLCEHTGAGFRPQHAKNKWTWILWAHYVFLTDEHMHAYTAADIRTLLTVAV